MQPSKLETMSEKLYTKVDVLYRDAGNWKQSESYIVENKLTLEQLAPYLESDSRFIGSDVGIEDLMFRSAERGGWVLGSDDHPWLELNELRPATKEEALKAQQENRFLGTAEELLQRFKTASDADWPNWTDLTERINLARDETEGTEARFTPSDEAPKSMYDIQRDAASDEHKTAKGAAGPVGRPGSGRPSPH
jgi:hypothetical protein